MAVSKLLNPNANPFVPGQTPTLISNQDFYSSPPWLNYIHPSLYPPNIAANCYNHTFIDQRPTFHSLYLFPSRACLTDKLLKNPNAELSKLRLVVNEVSEEKKKEKKKKKKFGVRVVGAEGRDGGHGGEFTVSEKPVVSSKQRPEKDIGNGAVIPFPTELSELEASGKTTVMIRNIPNQFSRRDLLRILNQHCRSQNENLSAVEKPIKSGYDFIYLPMDFNKFWREKRIANLGYAFVNFISPIAAWRFYKLFDNLNWQVPVNNKICEVTLAVTQGRVGLEERFRTKLFYCHTDEYLPLAINPVCYGVGSYRHGRNIGRRVPTFPRRGIVKSMPKLAVCP